MKTKIKVLEIVGQLGLGGTEYATQLYSKYLNKDIFEVKVVALYAGGERVKEVQNLGIEVYVIDKDLPLLEKLVIGTDVIHWHGSGLVADNLFKIIKQHKPKLVIQTNVFGWYTPNNHYYDLIDFDLYISKMILVRRMKLDENAFPHKRKFLSYPVDIDFLEKNAPSRDEISKFKAEYNLTSRFLVGRIGRASDSKFDLITFEGFKEFLKYNPTACFVLVGATDLMIAYINYLGIADNIRIIPNTIELKTLLVYYSALDTFFAASSIGESFGMVIAEAMSMGTPVLTVHTPKRDNAQIELVENMQTGIVVPRLRKNIALALKEISENDQLVANLSKKSVQKVKNEFYAQKVVKSLEDLILKEFRLTHESGDTILYDWNTEMASEYKKKCLNLYGSLDTVGKMKIWLFDSYPYQIIRKMFLKIIVKVYPKRLSGRS